MFRSLMLASLIAATACADGNGNEPLVFSVDGDRFVARGEIDEKGLNSFEILVEDHPAIRVLILRQIGGSVDDAANVELGRLIRQMGFTTVVPTDGLVASGGTDLFLAGVRRILEPGACVGVHSWAAENFTALDIPASSSEHDHYLDYYDDIGIDPAFYWFTIEAAPAEEMHWMTASEADQFGVPTGPVRSLSSAEVCNNR